MKRTDLTIRQSPRGDFIAAIYLPRHLGDKCHGLHQMRHLTADAAAEWLCNVARYHLTKRANFNAAQRARKMGKEVTP